MRQKFTSSTLAQTFDRRSFVVGAVQGGIGLLLAARMGYIAVAENEKYEMEAESNRVNLTLIPPRRGWILDRNGSPLASNRADFRVDIIPERLADPDATITQLGELLRFTPVEGLGERAGSEFLPHASADPSHPHQPQTVEVGDEAGDDGEQHDRQH